MRNEITAAVLFLVQLIEKSEKFSPDQLDCFQQRLVELLMERFKNHWFPDKPFKGNFNYFKIVKLMIFNLT
jgi:protein Tob/BTG